MCCIGKLFTKWPPNINFYDAEAKQYLCNDTSMCLMKTLQAEHLQLLAHLMSSYLTN